MPADTARSLVSDLVTAVRLWFVLQLNQAVPLEPDPREFKGIRWFDTDETRDWPPDTYDPEMSRFVGKVTTAQGYRGW